MENQDLVRNFSKLSEPWDANRPFQELVQRVQEVQEFDNDRGRTISDEDTVDTIYMMVYKTGLFYYDCDKWDDKQRDEITWTNFQAHFQAAQQKYNRKQKVATRAGGYHGANNLREMDGTHDAIIHLATADAANRETMIADFTASVAVLTQQLQQANTVHNRGYGIPVDR